MRPTFLTLKTPPLASPSEIWRWHIPVVDARVVSPPDLHSKTCPAELVSYQSGFFTRNLFIVVKQVQVQRYFLFNNRWIQKTDHSHPFLPSLLVRTPKNTAFRLQLSTSCFLRIFFWWAKESTTKLPATKVTIGHQFSAKVLVERPWRNS